MSVNMYKCRACSATLNNNDLSRLVEKYGMEIPLDKLFHEWCEPKEDDDSVAESRSRG